MLLSSGTFVVRQVGVEAFIPKLECETQAFPVSHWWLNLDVDVPSL